MAKLTAPLFSLGARGKLGNALVYFPWKGIDAVRRYVVPTNPNTTAQNTQRANLEAGVTEWHAALYTELDKGAWNRLALTLESVMSGFNAFMQTFVLQKILGNIWYRIRFVTTHTILATSFKVNGEGADIAPSPICYYGTSKTSMLGTATGVFQVGQYWLFTITGLVADTLYYFQIRRGTSGTNYGKTGIYQQKTLAA